MNKVRNLSSAGWLILFFEAAERNAIYPISMEVLHKLIYLANVLSPLCNIKMPNEYTLKNIRGPYFPQVQNDIGYLIANSIVEVKSLESFRDEYGFWLRGNYRITKAGLVFSEKINEGNSMLELYSFFLRDFFRALSYLEPLALSKIYSAEVHYFIAINNHCVDISIPKNNYAKYATSKLFPKDRIPTPRESIHRYINYLSEAIKVEGEGE